jgi:hypothetical protein
LPTLVKLQTVPVIQTDVQGSGSSGFQCFRQALFGGWEDNSCFPELGNAAFGKKFSTASALVTSFDRYEEGFAVDLDTPHNGAVCLCRSVGTKHRYMFVNSTNQPININCALKKTGNARLFSPLEGENKSFRSYPDKSGTRYEFTLGAYDVLIVTE